MNDSNNMGKSNSPKIATLDQNNISLRNHFKVAGVFTITAATARLVRCNLPPEGTNPDNSSASLGYIIVDTRKCQCCLTCMIACSLVNEGRVNLSKSRIQVVHSSMTSHKCDLCLNAPYHFYFDGRGIDGIQTCASVCPMKAIQFTTELPTNDERDTTRHPRTKKRGYVYNASWRVL